MKHPEEIKVIESLLNQTNAHCAALILDIARYKLFTNKKRFIKPILNSIDAIRLVLDSLESTLNETSGKNKK